MKLTLKDRVLILKTVLPDYDSRQGIILKKSIVSKINLSTKEAGEVVMAQTGHGQYDVSFRSAEAITDVKDFDITAEELEYLKAKVDYLDADGQFSEFVLDTYNKILDEPEELEKEAKEYLKAE